MIGCEIKRFYTLLKMGRKTLQRPKSQLTVFFASYLLHTEQVSDPGYRISVEKVLHI